MKRCGTVREDICGKKSLKRWLYSRKDGWIVLCRSAEKFWVKPGTGVENLEDIAGFDFRDNNFSTPYLYLTNLSPLPLPSCWIRGIKKGQLLRPFSCIHSQHLSASQPLYQQSYPRGSSRHPEQITFVQLATLRRVFNTSSSSSCASLPFRYE